MDADLVWVLWNRLRGCLIKIFLKTWWVSDSNLCGGLWHVQVILVVGLLLTACYLILAESTLLILFESHTVNHMITKTSLFIQVCLYLRLFKVCSGIENILDYINSLQWPTCKRTQWNSASSLNSKDCARGIPCWLQQVRRVRLYGLMQAWCGCQFLFQPNRSYTQWTTLDHLIRQV